MNLDRVIRGREYLSRDGGLGPRVLPFPLGLWDRWDYILIELILFADEKGATKCRFRRLDELYVRGIVKSLSILPNLTLMSTKNCKVPQIHISKPKDLSLWCIFRSLFPLPSLYLRDFYFYF